MMSPSNMNAALASSMNQTESPPDAKRPRPNSMGPTSMAGFSAGMVPNAGQGMGPNANAAVSGGPNANMAQLMGNNAGQSPGQTQAQLLGKGWQQNLTPQQIQFLQQRNAFMQQQQNRMMMSGQNGPQASGAGGMTPQNAAMLGGNVGNMTQMMMQQQFLRMQQQKMQQAQAQNQQQLMQQQQQQHQQQQLQQTVNGPQSRQPPTPSSDLQVQGQQARLLQQSRKQSPVDSASQPLSSQKIIQNQAPNDTGPHRSGSLASEGETLSNNTPNVSTSGNNTTNVGPNGQTLSSNEAKIASNSSPKLSVSQQGTTPSPKLSKSNSVASPIKPQELQQPISSQSSPQISNSEAPKASDTVVSDTPTTDVISNTPTSAPLSANDSKTQSSNPLDIDQFIMDEDFSNFFENADGDGLELGDEMDSDAFGNIDFFSNVGFMGGTENQAEAQPNEQVLQPHAQLAGHTNKVSTCAISNKGNWLASAGHDKKVIIWSIPNKSMKCMLDGHTQQITNARFTPDDRDLLATASYDKTVRIWSVSSSSKIECVTTFSGHTRSVTAVDFCPMNDNCCSVDAEGELKVWNAYTGVCEKTIRLSSASKYSGYSSNPVRYNPKIGSKAATAISNTLIYIDVFACEDNSSAADHPSTRTFSTQHNKNIFIVDWSPNGSFLLTASEDLICIWDTVTFKVIYTQQPQTGKISSCCFLANDTPNSDSKTMRVAIGEYEIIYIWAFAGGDGEAKLKAIPGAQNGVVSCLASGCTNDVPTNDNSSRTLLASASGSKDGNLKTWNVCS
ncbi:hypothetical protein K7432_001594 [Basidiobolus ranarum]|uniref:WD40 repeat-like protein n=1 Tax=Basidiobolus ranarum TaxID=34480 RepID=A0ABR2W984_9FUNG